MGLRSVVKLVIFAGLAVFLGYRVFLAYRTAQAPAAAAVKKGGGKVVSVSVGRPQTAAVREEILITGSLKPKQQVDVTAKATGRIEKLIFQVGDVVKKDDLIAVLEDAELQQQIKRATAARGVVRATMAQRRAELAMASADLKRAETLLDGGLLSRQDYEAKKTGLQVVEAQLELAKAQEQQAEADLNELNIQLAQRQIFAPMNSVVAQRFVDVGALVNASAPIVRLVDLSTMVTIANLPERDVGKLRVGAPAKVNVDAYGEQAFSARVSRVSPVMDVATRSAMVEVEIPNRDGRLKAEMFARVSLDLSSTRMAVVIPREALVYRGQQPGVYVMQAKKPMFRNIEPGLTQGDKIEVLSNLGLDETIVTRGATMLADGDTVRIVEDGSPPRPRSREASVKRQAARRSE